MLLNKRKWENFQGESNENPVYSIYLQGNWFPLCRNKYIHYSQSKNNTWKLPEHFISSRLCFVLYHMMKFHAVCSTIHRAAITPGPVFLHGHCLFLGHSSLTILVIKLNAREFSTGM